MDSETDLLIVGASTRAAAFSALRAGLRPRCADLFADADLRIRCPTERIPAGGYPALFAELLRQPSTVPWMYTGGVENRRRLVGMLAARRPLWGNDRDVLARCRNPWFVASLLAAARLPHPAVRGVRDGPPRQGRWLVKPLRGAGGSGIVFAGETTPRRPAYLQELIEGEPYAAVFVGDGSASHLLGVSRQFVGEAWLHAGRFRYCGSLTPTSLPLGAREMLAQLGRVLVSGCGLRGLFGVDFIMRDGVPFPVEVNPRYTASMEVCEYERGLPALTLHCRVFGCSAGHACTPRFTGPPIPGPAGRKLWPTAKAILFARQSFTFPAEGPWMAYLDPGRSVDTMPDFADIPAAGQRIETGQPILTLFASAPEAASCSQALRRSVDALDPLLFGR